MPLIPGLPLYPAGNEKTIDGVTRLSWKKTLLSFLKYLILCQNNWSNYDEERKDELITFFCIGDHENLFNFPFDAEKYLEHWIKPSLCWTYNRPLAN